MSAATGTDVTLATKKLCPACTYTAFDNGWDSTEVVTCETVVWDVGKKATATVNIDDCAESAENT